MTEPKRLQPNKYEPSEGWLEREAILRRHYEQLAGFCEQMDGTKPFDYLPMLRDLRAARDAAKREMEGM